MLAALNLMQFQGYLWLSSAKIGAGHYGLYNRLSVLYFPFSEAPPNCQNGCTPPLFTGDR
jgi:hypothetical protein